MPRGLRKSGSGSRIVYPRKISGHQFIEIGSRVLIGHHCWIQAISEYAEQRFSPEIIVMDDVYIGNYCNIVSINSIRIGKGSVLSEAVYISDNAHGLDPNAGPIMLQPLTTRGPVTLGDSCFIGYGACVLPGVSLGDYCVVGANSVVTKSFPAYSMIAGSPGRCIKRFDSTTATWMVV